MHTVNARTVACMTETQWPATFLAAVYHVGPVHRRCNPPDLITLLPKKRQPTFRVVGNGEPQGTPALGRVRGSSCPLAGAACPLRPSRAAPPRVALPRTGAVSARTRAKRVAERASFACQRRQASQRGNERSSERAGAAARCSCRGPRSARAAAHRGHLSRPRSLLRMC